MRLESSEHQDQIYIDHLPCKSNYQIDARKRKEHSTQHRHPAKNTQQGERSSLIQSMEGGRGGGKRLKKKRWIGSPILHKERGRDDDDVSLGI